MSVRAWTVNGSSIVDLESSPTSSPGLGVSTDFASWLHRLAHESSNPLLKSQIAVLIAQDSTLLRRGPELLQAILDVLNPTSPEHAFDRMDDHTTFVQSDGETGSQCLRRFLFVSQCHERANQVHLSLATQRTQLLFAFRKGPCRSVLKPLFTKIALGRRLPKVDRLLSDCSLDDLASAVDFYLLSTHNNPDHFKNQCLQKGKTVEWLRPHGAVQLPSGATSTTPARRAGGSGSAAPPSTPAPSASSGSRSATSFLDALKPFEDGKVPSDQIKDFHKRFACPFCLHRREHNRAAESACPC